MANRLGDLPVELVARCVPMVPWRVCETGFTGFRCARVIGTAPLAALPGKLVRDHDVRPAAAKGCERASLCLIAFR